MANYKQESRYIDSYYGGHYDAGPIPPPPPPQHHYHQEMYQDDNHYAMHNLNAYNHNDHAASPVLATDEGYGVKTQVKQNGEYQHLADSSRMGVAAGAGGVLYVEEPKRRSCMDKLCCGCCTCFPRWTRWLCCILFLIIVILGIVVGVLAAIFKVPEVKFNGIQGEPQFTLNGTIANLAFNLDISIDNQNIESVTFENVQAKAYYPGVTNSIGGGTLQNVHISSHAVTKIIFPFTLSINANDPSMAQILLDIMSKCGMTGAEATGITIKYDVIPTVNIIGIKISPTISNSANVPCSSASIPDLSSITSLIPSNLESYIPTDVGST
ncbi:hypothetical protein BX666DRAFT_2114524 [Dichotomocladium elegans]|nr:hypothetical protein BX666DRAFT_2114524 [Dichotomocladium elegans]